MTRILTLLAALSLAMELPALAHHQGRHRRMVEASVYDAWYHGRLTASGTPYIHWSTDMCAHPWLPFGSWVQLRYRGRSATCEIVDRTPLARIDMSRGVAARLGLDGHALVVVELAEL